MKNKEQQYEEYKSNGGSLDFHGWLAAFKYDPSLEYTPEQLRDWMVNNENDYGTYPSKDEWKKMESENEESKIWRDEYKKEKREVLADTILSLLVDLPKERIDSILEGETPEELVDYCKRIYDHQFDANVDAYGVAGADEIAWQEALGIFNDTSDRE